MMIAFSATHKINGENIYLLNTNNHGARVRCLTAGQELSAYGEVYWLPGSNQLLFAATPPQHPYSTLYILALDTGTIVPFMPELEPKIITAVTANNYIFFSGRDGYFSVPAGGSRADCNRLHLEGFIRISANGQWVVSCADARFDHPGHAHIAIQTLDGSWHQELILTDPERDHYADLGDIAVSPDGANIAYSANYGEVWMIQRNGSERKHVGWSSYGWYDFCWSPDSTCIAYSYLDDGDDSDDSDDGPEITHANMDMADIPIEDIEDIEHIEGFAYVENDIDIRNARIDITDIRTEERWLITTFQTRQRAVWQWTPDSQAIIYTNQTVDGDELYIAERYGQHQQKLIGLEDDFVAIYSIAGA